MEIAVTDSSQVVKLSKKKYEHLIPDNFRLRSLPVEKMPLEGGDETDSSPFVYLKHRLSYPEHRGKTILQNMEYLTLHT